MAKQRRFVVWLFGATILFVNCFAGAQNGESFKARLSTVPVDASMLARVAGSGSLKAALTGNKLTITGTFQGLRSPATHASIHLGPKGIRGPAVHDLTVSLATMGNVSGSLDLTPAEVADLKGSRFYVQIDSERAPEGNLWGWLLP
jgi:hypothetical protein